MSTMAAKAERQFLRDEEARAAKRRTCASCGHLCDSEGEFHPNLFCVLKKAGYVDPWGEFKWAVERLGLSVPKRPPLVRDLPLTTEGACRGEGCEVVSKYRKKPVVIDAVHYTGEFPLDFLGNSERAVRSAGDSSGAIEIVTLEGVMRADVGDWIIRGVKGELYPCKPDIFAATYEPASRPVSGAADDVLELVAALRPVCDALPPGSIRDRLEAALSHSVGGGGGDE